MDDLLCFHAFEQIYGIPLNQVLETFEEHKITRVPRLHHAFAGLCNHNGIIFPVISFSKLCGKDIPDKRTCMLLIKIEEQTLILRVNDVPFIVYENQISQSTPYHGKDEYLVIDEICCYQKEMIDILNMEKIVEKLSNHLLEEDFK